MIRAYNYSALSTAYRCQMLYKHLYIDKLTPEGPKSGDMAFGSAIHLAIETMLKQGGDWELDFKLFWEAEKLKDNTYTRNDWKALEEQGIKLLSRFERLHLKKFKPFMIEQTLTGTIRDIQLYGTPDFVGEYEGVRSVVDFKTAGYRYPKERLFTSEQMLLYTHLVNQSLKEDYVKQLVYIVFIKGNEPSIQTLVRTVDKEDLKQALSNIDMQACQLRELETTQLYTKNYNGCANGGKCQFFSKCFPHIKE